MTTEAPEKKRRRLSDEDMERLMEFRLLDDDFMRIVFDDNIEATELILNVFLEREDMKVISVKAQTEVKNVSGRSVRFDIYAVDAQGKHYDIEIQRQDRGAGERRARYNSSMLDTRMLEAGQDTDELRDSYVIFITENDVRGKGYPIYRISRMDERTHEPFEDGSHIIYVNAAYKNDSDPIGRLMHDFRSVRADDMYNRELADKVRYFKETEGGQDKMSSVMEKIEYAAAYKERSKIVLYMVQHSKLSLEDVSKVTGLSLKDVEQIVGRRNI